MDKYQSATPHEETVNFQVHNDRYHTGRYYHGLPEYFDEQGKYLLERLEDGSHKRINAIQDKITANIKTVSDDIALEIAVAKTMLDATKVGIVIVNGNWYQVAIAKSKLVVIQLWEKIKWLLRKR